MDAIGRAIKFYLDPFEPLLQAIVRAEGGKAAYLRAIRCSKPNCANFEEALAWGVKTIRSRLIAYCMFCDGMSNGDEGDHEKGLDPLFVLEPLDCRDPWTYEQAPRRLILSDDFIRFLGARWAPLEAENDPERTNQYWVGNVTKIYHQLIRAVPDPSRRP